MANFQTIYTCALILAVITFQETIFTEGRRQLKHTRRQELTFTKGRNDLGKHGGSTKYSHQKPTKKENNIQVSVVTDVDTAGISRKKENLKRQAPHQSRAFGDSAKQSVEDFRPTAPGSSPGVGHSFVDLNVDIQQKASSKSSGVQTAAGNTHHLRPTLHGQNPGSVYSSPNKHAKPNA